ncbi:MAG: VCBS repeat-containing protein, partial [Anaerolineae bacterium]|nr:VCBS repeat-containing protein [Anaerolineae bacterium]
MVLLLVLVLFLVVTGSFSFRPSLVYAAPIKVVLSGESGEVLERSSPAVADFNGDGYKEIVVGGSLGTLSVISYNGASWSEVWHRQTADDLVGAPAGCGNGKSNVQSAPVIADLDNDGDLEIVVSVGGMPSDKRNGGVLVYQYTGGPPSWSFSRASGWPQPKTDGGNVDGSDADGCWDGFWASPAVGDLDGDGDLEITVGSFDRRIHAWHHDGTEMDGWPVYRQTEEGVDCLVRGGNWSSPAMGDI